MSLFVLSKISNLLFGFESFMAATCFFSNTCIIITMKTAIILAGKHDITDAMYKPIESEFKAQGWERVIFYEPDWSVKSVRKLVADFWEKVPADAQSLTLLGFFWAL